MQIKRNGANSLWQQMLKCFCLLGLIVNLALWILPARLKPIRVKHWIEDYKVALVEQTSQYGLGADGWVKGRFSVEYSEGARRAIQVLRKDWHENIEHSKTPRPVSTWQLLYDEWGPTHLVRPDGVIVSEVGLVISIPYSLGTIGCGTMLVLLQVWSVFNSRARKPRTAFTTTTQAPTPGR